MTSRVPITGILILSALQAERLHGYGILQRARTLDDADRTLRASTVYDAIARLLRDELVVDAGSDVVDGRLRRYYAITDAGRRALDDQPLELEGRPVPRTAPAGRAAPGPVPA